MSGAPHNCFLTGLGRSVLAWAASCEWHSAENVTGRMGGQPGGLESDVLGSHLSRSDFMLLGKSLLLGGGGACL